MDYFRNVLLPRKKRLFGLDKSNCRVYPKHSCIMFSFNSPAIYDFYCYLGIPCGSKRDIAVPEFVMNGSNALKAAFLRGLVDSDGSLSFKKKHKNVHYYPTIGFTMKSEKLWGGVSRLLSSLGFGFTAYQWRKRDKRNGKVYGCCGIDINGEGNLVKWMRLVGFSNKKHAAKHSTWKAHRVYERSGPREI